MTLQGRTMQCLKKSQKTQEKRGNCSIPTLSCFANMSNWKKEAFTFPYMRNGGGASCDFRPTFL